MIKSWAFAIIDSDLITEKPDALTTFHLDDLADGFIEFSSDLKDDYFGNVRRAHLYKQDCTKKGILTLRGK
ncbi:MAG: hypothetical protein NT121_00045, partial [Chloroflexi bacterium]|nr:hypothetical protein [Chloroflexota bacterium]